ncbi:MAG: prepilin-type N-terminal cleavage/methylation domain-containing protein [Bacillaceae bacterium]|nr:prepilin-type N-terminal cleavage/methylation domain-containing protein [Bacillaceae bacterium]
MACNNEKGITLVELLAALTIAFIISGLVAAIFFQTFRNADRSDSHINLRQEANIIVQMFSTAHEKEDYTFQYTKSSNGNWEMKIGDIVMNSRYYDIELTFENRTAENEERSISINTKNNDPSTSKSLSIAVSNPINIKKLKLINKDDPSLTFELTTSISRL